MGILCSIDLSSLEFSDITGALIVVFILWQVIKNLKEMKKSAKDSLKREEGWDYAAKVVKEKEKVWDDAVAISDRERQQITDTFNAKLRTQDLKIDRLSEMMTKMIKAMNVLLEDQVEKGANGRVKEMHTELNDYVVEQFGK